MTEYSHTFELPQVNDACSDLVSDNAELLIKYIYDNTDRSPYNDPKTRVGLVIKTLLRSGNDAVNINSAIIEPATQDLTALLDSTTNSVARKIYTDELTFLRRCTLLDDLISLNTVHAD